MTQEEIWQYCLNNNAWKLKVSWKTSLLIAEDKFDKIKNEFWKDINALHMFAKNRISLKSKSYIKHIHAVKKWNFYFVHQDYWNYNKFMPLYFVHLIIDVVPRFIYCGIKRKRILFCLDEKLYKKD